ncbi:hypothetical protein Patl1_16674 [Pistacia atlantica]|uniref:Uncharacterized protein n=1 Tax=Pistacia atlantica TaxID=434234 RepID=A0ACC1BA57_9ROSI|nr:hypothetical protein Patl1_16674 [Pistacia atlantica]
MLALTASPAPLASKCGIFTRFKVMAEKFPSFLPKEVENIKDPFARKLAARIERLPVQVSFSESSIMSSLVKPMIQSTTNPVVLLHGFDSSCLEWRYTYPLLEEAGLETWAIDILGWGFSDLERIPSCDVTSKREHFYQVIFTASRCYFLVTYAYCGLLFALEVLHQKAHGYWLDQVLVLLLQLTLQSIIQKLWENLVLIDASVYAEGTGNLSKLPRAVAYAGVILLLDEYKP